MAAFAWLVNVVYLICWIIVLIKVFQSGKILMGVLCICPLFALVYGWMEVNRLHIRNVMIVFTAAFVAGIVFNFAFHPYGPMR